MSIRECFKKQRGAKRRQGGCLYAHGFGGSYYIVSMRTDRSRTFPSCKYICSQIFFLYEPKKIMVPDIDDI